MAQNCPYYAGGKCNNPTDSREFDCSWPASNYDACSVYVLITDPARGRAQLLNAFSRGSPAPPAKKWWQFWK